MRYTCSGVRLPSVRLPIDFCPGVCKLLVVPYKSSAVQRNKAALFSKRKNVASAKQSLREASSSGTDGRGKWQAAVWRTRPTGAHPFATTICSARTSGFSRESSCHPERQVAAILKCFINASHEVMEPHIVGLREE